MASGLEHPGKGKAIENSSSILGQCQYLREQNGSRSLRGKADMGFQMQSRLCSEVKRGLSALEIGLSGRRESWPPPGPFLGTRPGTKLIGELSCRVAT